jgi:undecaprenyl-diphosphatase
VRVGGWLVAQFPAPDDTASANLAAPTTQCCDEQVPRLTRIPKHSTRPPRFRSADQRLLRAGMLPAGDGRVPAWRAASALGSRPAVYSLASASALLAARAGAPRPWRPVAAALGADCSQDLLKHLVQRQRPPRQDWLIQPHGSSLPSRHAALAAACAFGVRHPTFRRCAVLGAALAGASRVRLAVHWPSDVLCGWLLGAAWGLALGARRSGPSTPAGIPNPPPAEGNPA